MRVLAIKILRHAGDIPKDTNVFWQLLQWRRAIPLSFFAAHAIGFSYEGRPVWIRDTAGAVLDAAEAARLSAWLVEERAKAELFSVAQMDGNNASEKAL